MRFERYDCSRGCPVEATLERLPARLPRSLDDIYEVDREARRIAAEVIR